METKEIDSRIIEGESEFIKSFFDALKGSPDYETLKEKPFVEPDGRSNLLNYLNMGVVEKFLRHLQQNPETVNTFMSNGLEWVNGNVAFNENGVSYMDAKELVHLYVNLLALLAGAPTVFMKIGALTMYSMAPETVKNWI